MSGDELDDLVRLRQPRPRLQVDVDEEVQGASPSGGTGGALFVGGRRIAIPTFGLTLGSGPADGVHVDGSGVAPGHVRVAPAAGGVAVERGTAGSAIAYVNGEPLAAGQRRTLRRGDSIALGQVVAHVAPDAGGPVRLPRIAQVPGGTVRASHRAFSIGRDSACDMVLDHPTVSRQHAQIVVGSDGQAIIEDRGSATGVRVNGRVVRRGALARGDQIAIGPFRVLYDGEELIERRAAPGLPIGGYDVSVTVGGTTILEPVTLHLHPAELVAIIGESGAGKSTLLKALAGVTTPTTGSVRAGGEHLASRLSDIGYVPQFDIVHGRLTIREALDYAARLRLPADTGRGERAARVQALIVQLGLEERADTQVDRLSGGQRKRVAVGTELVHRPGALFLDEPTTGLDPHLERHMMGLFRSLADTGQTVALVTHGTANLRLCDRVVVMGRGGRLRFDGTPDELVSAFDVAAFEDVYSRLAETPNAPPFRSAAAPPPPPAPAPTAAPRQIRHSLQHQTTVLAQRYARLFLRDRRHIRTVLTQVPILGLLTALLFDADVFARAASDPPELFAGKAAQLLFLMVTIAIWLGSINAAREIVKERSVLVRETAVGVQLPAYIASKLVVLLSLATVQTVCFGVIVLVLRPLQDGRVALASLIAVLVISSWLAVLLGLVVSAQANSEDQATGVIPLLLVPQLLFGGAIVTIEEMTGFMQVLSALVPARWSFAAAGDAIHLRERIEEDPIFSRSSTYGEGFFNLDLLAFWLVGCVFGVLFLAALVLLLRRIEPA